MRRFIFLALSTLLAGFAACSDDDGSNVVPNAPPGAGSGGGGAGGAPDAGPGAGAGGGVGGRGGTGGGGAGGSGGSAGCTPISRPDAGSEDAGALDAGSTDAGLDASAEGPPNGIVSFEQDVHPLFAEHCGPCHVSDGSGGHNIGGADLALAYDQAVTLGQDIVARVDGGGMPPDYAPPPNDCGAEGGYQPGDPGCLSVAQVALIQTWIDQCYPR
jgi:hypothetical protein